MRHALPRDRRVHRWPWAALAAMMLVTACASAGRPATERDAATATVQQATDPGVIHVHALGVNPRDGALFAATHTGLFRIAADGAAERVADRHQDTMGFTVIGPDHFLGSGHPDLREMRERGAPPLLGLIESTDAGRTWKPRSLSGKADFHALVAAHGRIYGYDSTGGAVMVSSDGTTWETRAKLPLSGIAVSPAEPELLIAATPAGPQRSGDGGRSWRALPGPAAVLLAWPSADALWAVTATAELYRSADGGDAWQRRGVLPDRPAALLATSDTLYVALHDQGIVRSRDGGATWQSVYRPAGGR